MLDQISLFLAKVCDCISGVFLVIISSLTIYCVIMRYVFNLPPAWTEELTLYMLMWMSLLSASVLIREEGGHIGVTAFRALLPLPCRKSLELFSDICIISFSLIWMYISWITLDIVHDEMAASLPISLGFAFASQPVCAFLMAIQAIIVFIKCIASFKELQTEA